MIVLISNALVFTSNAVDDASKEIIGGVIVLFIVVAIVYTIGTVIYNFKKSRRHKNGEVVFTTEVKKVLNKNHLKIDLRCRPKLVDNHHTKISMQTTVFVKLVVGYDEGLSRRQMDICKETTKIYLEDVYSIIHDDDLDDEEENILKENASFISTIHGKSPEAKSSTQGSVQFPRPARTIFKVLFSQTQRDPMTEFEGFSTQDFKE